MKQKASTGQLGNLPLRAHCQMLNSCTPLGKAPGLEGEPTAAQVWLWTGTTLPLRTSDSLSAKKRTTTFRPPPPLSATCETRGTSRSSEWSSAGSSSAGSSPAGWSTPCQPGWSCRLCARASLTTTTATTSTQRKRNVSSKIKRGTTGTPCFLKGL